MKLKTRIKRLINKAHIMCWSVEEVQGSLLFILEEYGVSDKKESDK